MYIDTYMYSLQLTVPGNLQVPYMYRRTFLEYMSCTSTCTVHIHTYTCTGTGTRYGTCTVAETYKKQYLNIVTYILHVPVLQYRCSTVRITCTCMYCTCTPVPYM